MVCIMNVCNIENLICNLMKLKLYKRKITFWGHKFGDQDWKLKKSLYKKIKFLTNFYHLVGKVCYPSEGFHVS